MVLAQSLSRVSQDCKAQILDRLAELTPREAADVHSLTDIEARIEVLLSAGAADLAAQYIEAERDLRTWGTVPGRRVTRLRNDFRLHLLRSEWDDIASTTIPDDLPPADTQDARDTVAFYQALALLLKPDGNPGAAADAFGRLRQRRPDIVAYAFNLFAAQIAMLLGGDLFGQLNGEQRATARQALADAESAFARAEPPDADGFTINRAHLTLAVGDPGTTIAILDTLGQTRVGDQAAAYRAVALSRLGRSAEAEGALIAAERAFGKSPILIAAREHVRAGTAQYGALNVALTDDHS